ncbi:MAG: hypothetical protein KJO82_12545, partial [Gammaproteobacteria bacterium]|nr:hypothetical protein [Gammaproteobacteria bacterium]
MAVSIALATLLFACATSQSPVVEKLDELTAVTITYSRTPMILSPNTSYDPKAPKEFVQLGAIEVNRMGALEYFLWLGITDESVRKSAHENPPSFETVVVSAGDEEFQLDVHGWTQTSIGTSEAVYKKLFRTSLDAYYAVSLEQIRWLTEADGIRIRTTGDEPREYQLWYRPTTASDDLAEFVRVVSQ